MSKIPKTGAIALLAAAAIAGIVLLIHDRVSREPPQAEQAPKKAEPRPVPADERSAQHERPKQTIERLPFPQGSRDSIAARMTATRQRAMQERKSGSEPDVTKQSEKGTETSLAQPKLSPSEFLVAFREALGKADPNEIRAVLEKAPQDAATVEALKTIMRNASETASAQRYAADALLRIGTADSVQFVLDQILTAYRAGDETRASAPLPAWEAPTTTAGIQALFDFLLGRGQYAQAQQDRPDELVNVVRKSLRSASDREAVGSLAAALYLEAQVMVNTNAMWELFEGISHPIMHSQLAAQAYLAGSEVTAYQFLNRLEQIDDQGVVQAIVSTLGGGATPLEMQLLYCLDGAHFTLIKQILDCFTLCDRQQLTCRTANSSCLWLSRCHR